jgi:hypothetical protein
MMEILPHRTSQMRGLLKTLLVVAVLTGAGAAAWRPATTWWANRTRPKFDTLASERGDVIEVINSKALFNRSSRCMSGPSSPGRSSASTPTSTRR